MKFNFKKIGRKIFLILKRLFIVLTELLWGLISLTSIVVILEAEDKVIMHVIISVIIVLGGFFVLWITSERKMKFGSKYLKDNKRIKELVNNENFQKVEFYKGKLEVSENWLKINGIYLPKNFIIGTYEITGNRSSRFDTEMYAVHFLLITGESKFYIEIPYNNYTELQKNLYILKEYLPKAMITDKRYLFLWRIHHKKKIKLNRKKMFNEIGLERLIYEWQDVHKQFSMDGVMTGEVVYGNLVDIEVDGDSSGKYVTGKVDELLDVRDNENGCLVRLKDNGLVGRVKNVHGNMKYSEYKLDDKYK